MQKLQVKVICGMLNGVVSLDCQRGILCRSGDMKIVSKDREMI